MKIRYLISNVLVFFFLIGNAYADNNSVVGTKMSAGGEKVEDNTIIQPNQTGQQIDVQNTNNQTQHEDTGPVFYHKQRRMQNPLQINLLVGVGRSNPTPVGPGYGFHLGYQLSESIYIGWTSHAYAEGKNIWDDNRSYEYGDEDYDDNRQVYGQKGVEKTESELDPQHLLQLRLIPWDFGLYFSFGVLHQGAIKTTTKFKEQERTIGESTYNTSLEATVEYKSWTGLATGVGFNYIFDNGITLGTEFNVGLGVNSANATVENTGSVTVDPDDLDYWKKQIESNEKMAPCMMIFSMGYAF